jgi:biotin synthase
METDVLQATLGRIRADKSPKTEDLELLLSAKDKDAQEAIRACADQVRQQHVGDGVYLRGIVEFSNHCRNTCSYCGLNRNNQKLVRYRLTNDQILDAVKSIAAAGITTVVLQAGEEEGMTADWLAEVIQQIKAGHPDMAATLSVGERADTDYELWRRAGADRYLLKIETSDQRLYEAMHPGMSFTNRVRCLKTLKSLGYQTGSGVIVGLRGQTPAILAHDLLFFAEHSFEMIGIGPFIPHRQTKLAADQAGAVAMVLKMVALTRIITKNTNLPATTALGSLERDFRLDGLRAGANVLMPNFTPVEYKALYEIYPGKRCIAESGGACVGCLDTQVRSIGRTLDYSRGDLQTTNDEVRTAN